MSQRVVVRGEVNPGGVAEAKASLNRAFSRVLQTRSRVSLPWAG